MRFERRKLVSAVTFPAISEAMRPLSALAFLAISAIALIPNVQAQSTCGLREVSDCPLLSKLHQAIAIVQFVTIVTSVN